ncbi:MAG: hypothetical protein AVDCRST_MAG29-377, partial [uncultured Nocardioidaceae bacterium]
CGSAPSPASHAVRGRWVVASQVGDSAWRRCAGAAGARPAQHGGGALSSG